MKSRGTKALGCRTPPGNKKESLKSIAAGILFNRFLDFYLIYIEGANSEPFVYFRRAAMPQEKFWGRHTANGGNRKSPETA